MHSLTLHHRVGSLVAEAHEPVHGRARVTNPVTPPTRTYSGHITTIKSRIDHATDSSATCATRSTNESKQIENVPFAVVINYLQLFMIK